MIIKGASVRHTDAVFRLKGREPSASANAHPTCPLVILPRTTLATVRNPRLEPRAGAHLTKVTHMHRPTGEPDFDRFLTSRFLTKKSDAARLPEGSAAAGLARGHEIQTRRLFSHWKCRYSLKPKSAMRSRRRAWTSRRFIPCLIARRTRNPELIPMLRVELLELLSVQAVNVFGLNCPGFENPLEILARRSPRLGAIPTTNESSARPATARRHC